MNATDRQTIRHASIFFGITAAIGLIGTVTCAYFEAQTYQRLTGKEVTTWDALWVELRITP